VLDEADRTIDPARREALVGQAERIVFERAPWVPTHAARTFVVRQPRVRGLSPTPYAVAPYESVWLAPESAQPLALAPRPASAREVGQ